MQVSKVNKLKEGRTYNVFYFVGKRKGVTKLVGLWMYVSIKEKEFLPLTHAD